jgi:hypothetical protein
VATHPDEIEFWIPEPEKFDATPGGITWRDSALRPREPFRADTGREYAVPSSLGRPGRPLREHRPRPGYLLDWFALLSQGAPAERVGRVLALAKEWGSPLTLCGVCGRRHVWRGDTTWQSRKPTLSLLLPPGVHEGDEGAHLRGEGSRLVHTGAESVDEWLTWADVLNAVRRVAIANREGRQGEPADVEKFWPVPMQPDDPHPDGDGSNEPEMPPGYRTARELTAAVRQAIANADHRQLVAAFVNKWLSATCVSPTLAYSAEASPGVPPMRIVRVGSILAWLGWVLREELTAESGGVRACAEPGCGLTFHLIRARTDTPSRRPRELCTLHDGRRRKRALPRPVSAADVREWRSDPLYDGPPRSVLEAEARRTVGHPAYVGKPTFSEPVVGSPWKVESEQSLDALAESGVEPDQSGDIPSRGSGFQDKWVRSSERSDGPVERVGRP